MSGTKVKKLTKEQEDLIPVYRDRWLDIGLKHTAPNPGEIIDDIDWLYEFSGLEKPKFVICLESPMACLVGVKIFESMLNKGAQVRDQVGDQVWDQVGAQVGAQVRAQVRDQVWGQKEAEYFSPFDIRSWSGWFGFLSFFKEQNLINIDDQLAINFEKSARILRKCYWLYPFSNVCFVSHSPKHTHMVDGELHNENGPSVEFSDGFKVYSIEGVRVPEKVVTSPESITLEDIQKEENAEVKRIMRERYGTGRYLNDTGATVVDFDNDFHGGFRALIEDKDGNRWLEGSDGSTGRVYFMRAKGETCKEAHESLWNGMLDESMRVGQS